MLAPRAFRVLDFKSIVDSGVCTLSGDGITVLAGQNEAGKTAVLLALRDFDLPQGVGSKTPEYLPEGKFDARPTVWVCFDVDVLRLVKALEEEGVEVPEPVLAELEREPRLWVKKDVRSASFHLADETAHLWGDQFPGSQADGTLSNSGEGGEEEGTKNDEDGRNPADVKLIGPHELAELLYSYWPNFTYFDSFEDILPREVALADILPKELTDGGAAKTSKRPPRPVLDFITLSGLDLKTLNQLDGQDKAINNYLQTCGARITGDFLKYWKQRVEGGTDVYLRVQHVRDAQGGAKLAFYVHDGGDQYPDQRSRGFLWFLSFYMRLAADQKRETAQGRFLLIDEPGSYLHARAQRDVLHMFEDQADGLKQVIYSTHSPFLLPPDKVHRIRIVLKKGSRGTLVLDRLTHPELRRDQFADTLSPVIAAIGLDIRESLTFAKNCSVIVEGISDYMYLMAWMKKLRPDLLRKINVFPGYGAKSLLLMASLFIGWGLSFVVLLDRDKEGNETGERLVRDLAVDEERIIQLANAVAIEDMFSCRDFNRILVGLDMDLMLNEGDRPSSFVKRQRIDKVLLARSYATHIEDVELDPTSRGRIVVLLDKLSAAVKG